MTKALRSLAAVVSSWLSPGTRYAPAERHDSSAIERRHSRKRRPILHAPRNVTARGDRRCHLTYDEVRPWAKSIRERVVDRTMPPWFADPAHGTFDNNPSLTKQEIDTIVSWVSNGSPKGDDKDLPATPRFSENWNIGEPDMVVSMQEPQAVPADGIVEYLNFTIPTEFTEDKWVQAVEIRPGNRAVVHHVIAFVQEPPGTESGSSATRRALGGRTHLAGFTPNRAGIVMPPGYARLIKAGSKIVFQMHYTPNGVATTDRTSSALIFAKGPVKRPAFTGNALNAQFVIPAGDPSYEVKSSTTFNEDVHILSFMPHMHFRGKDFYTAVYPDGRKEILLHVPSYDFNWQLNYKLKEPIAMPKGSRLTAWRTSTTRGPTASIPIRRRPCAGAIRPGKR
jgi:hypothetical protein